MKTIKIPDQAYEDLIKLAELLEKGRIIKGIYKVPITTAISYAVQTTLEPLTETTTYDPQTGKESNKLEKYEG